MLGHHFRTRLRAGVILLATTVLGATLSVDAEARVGRGRSVGRPSSARGFGYRRAAPPSRPPASNQPGVQPQDSAYGSRPGMGSSPRNDAPGGAPAPAYGANGPASGPMSPMGTPSAPMPPPARGGFWRGVAGGLAGGFLGSMLFGSLGHSSGVAPGSGWGPGNGTGTGTGAGSGPVAGGGGIGLLEVLLFAGLAYLAFRWWKQHKAMTPVTVPQGGSPETWTPSQTPSVDVPRFEAPPAPALASDPLLQMPSFPALAAAKIDPEVASDLFFRIQAAWTRRDLTPVLDLLVPEVKAQLEADLQELRSQGQINRLENISLRKVEVLESWREGDTENTAVRFSASLLDYTVDETSQRVVAGSDRDPVKFAEDWVFARDSGGTSWRLSSIEEATV